ncbi:ribonuclease P protein subunit p25-like protein [Centruroides vittatus]|uniref:ribonuclease P protein subunit p25-like protein n=1 Tax=Centruroides vittatus TaxID=120091 RepID=UPI00350F20D5
MAQKVNELENYTKSEVVEIEGEIDPCFKGFIDDIICIKVKTGSKLQNILRFALKAFKDETNQQILFTGVGHAINKTITCAEITKRKFKDIHQITKINYKKVEEIWKPKIEELDSLKVIREIPAIYILLSKQPLNAEEPGYQAPGSSDAFWKKSEDKPQKIRRRAQATYELPGSLSQKHQKK